MPSTFHPAQSRHRAPVVAVRWLLLALLAGQISPMSAAPVSFRNDVMAVLSKAGCNAGACHGNANGKGGFKLSLRGESPEEDFAALTREFAGRRVDLIEPERSLILLKPTTQLAHEGGKRFDKEAPGYTALFEWLKAGATSDVKEAPRLTKIEVTPQESILVEPANEVQIQAWATFSDGSRRDITRTATYDTSNPLAVVSPEGRVRREKAGETVVLVRYLDQQVPVRLAFVPARLEFKWTKTPENNFIDQHIFAKLRDMRMNPSDVCSDEIFVRRAHLDLIGKLPTADEARAFVMDRHRNKRVKLIDALLTRPEFADWWALKWSDLLRVEARTLDEKGMLGFHHWIRQSFATNKPMDQFVRELVAARGSTYQNPPANFYRANRDPVTRAETAAQVFLGIRLQCAQCHNHPFDRWSQNDYYDWAAAFGRVKYKVLENLRRDSNDSHEFKGEQIVFIGSRGEVKHPKTGKAAEPRMLLEERPMEVEPATPAVSAEGTEKPDASTELDQLARWITSPGNPFFARAQVNRVWFHLMGRGIVDPIDDFRPTNPASHPELLDKLAEEFVRQNFDLRHLIKRIAGSRAYQLSSEPNPTNAEDEINYSHALVRRLTAEQLLDAQAQVVDVPLKLRGFPAGTRAIQLPGAHTERRRGERISNADLFLELFGKPPRLLACECERSTDTTMGQAFALISGPGLNELLSKPDNRIGKWLAADRANEDLVDDLYWTSVGRTPGKAERESALKHLQSGQDKRAALEDIAWSLMNAKEFVLRK